MMDEKMQNSGNRGRNRFGSRLRVVFALAISFILMVLMAFFFSKLMRQEVQTGSVLGYTMRSGEITSRMRINLLKAVDLEKSALMAITDEESKTFADQSRVTADAVERDYRELKELIDKRGTGEEVTLLKEFTDCWKNFREIDEELLRLTVENTNIKAASLSYTAGAQAIGRFERAFMQLTEIRSSSAKEARISRLAYRAVSAALMIYALQAPHINEAQDKKMDEIESVMKAKEKVVKEVFADLMKLVDDRGRTFLDAASVAFEDFIKVNAEVVRLSRINSNIKSLELSLGRKRKVTVQCEEALNALQQVIRDKTFKATK